MELAEGERREAALAVLLAVADNHKPLLPHERVYKHHSVYSLDTAATPCGLFVNLSTLMCTAIELLPFDCILNGFRNRIYLHICSDVDAKNLLTATKKWQYAGREAEGSSSDECANVPRKLAIGVEGGFGVEDDFIDPDGSTAAMQKTYAYSLCVVPERFEYTPSQLFVANVAEDDGPSSTVLKCECMHKHLLRQLTFLSVNDGDAPMSVVNRARAVIEQGIGADIGATAQWEEEIVPSRHAENLIQTADPPRILSSAWSCAECGSRSNLWLNLSDGFIGCGRKLYGVGGGCLDGREGAAIRHFENTGRKFPLSVKLGTVTAYTADVYSYAEDEDAPVIDPKLPEHLAHFGINIQLLSKTEKSTNELAIDWNVKYEWLQVMENDTLLKAVNGPRYVGLRNLGNTCYINSIIQALLSVSELRYKYDRLYKPLLAALSCSTVSESAPPKDFSLQVAALVRILSCGWIRTERLQRLQTLIQSAEHLDLSVENLRSRVLQELPYLSRDSVAPVLFRDIVGDLHPEFACSRQQDAEEFLSLFLTWVADREKGEHQRLATLEQQCNEAGVTAAAMDALGLTDADIRCARDALQDASVQNLFTFSVEQRLKCLQSNKVRYTYDHQQVLALPIPIDIQQERQRLQKRHKSSGGSGNVEGDSVDERQDFEIDDTHRKGTDCLFPTVTFSSCLRAFASASKVSDYVSPVTGIRGGAEKTHLLASMPKYLVVFLKRFYISDTWEAKKIHCSVETPEEISLEEFRAFGIRADEEMLVDANDKCGGSSKKSEVFHQFDSELLATLQSMGFTENAAKRASLAVIGGADECVEWLMNHMDDADVNDPIASDGSRACPSSQKTSDAEDAEAISSLVSMGFTERQAKAALRATSASGRRDTNQAADWLLRNVNTLDDAVEGVVETMAPNDSRNDEDSSSDIPSIKRSIQSLNDGQGRYRLKAFVTHMGPNACGGHYVCHIRNDDGNWILYNDEKVAQTKKPPIDMAYIYIFERMIV